MYEIRSAVERGLGLGDFDQALGLMLKEWDRTRSPVLAALIQEVSDRATRSLPPVPSLPQKNALRDWVELARLKRPADVGRLLVSLRQVMAVGPSRLAIPRLDELLAMPPDPRVAVGIFEALRGPIKGWSDKGYVRAVKVLLRHGDVSQAAELEAALDVRSEDYMSLDDRARFDKVDAAWRERAALADPSVEDVVAVRAMLADAPDPVAAAAPILDADAFLRAIYADPGSDERRAVYADYLGEHGDPRGELITLQLEREAGRGSPASEKREKALLKAHQSAWLGPLAADIVIGETEWRRGFPVATKTKMAKLYQVEASCIRPDWATFERIRFQGAALITEAMVALHEARGVTEPAVRKLAKIRLPPRLRAIELVLPHDREMVEHEAVTTVLGMTAITQLELRMARWSRATPAGVAELIARGPHLTDLCITGPAVDGGGFYAPIVNRPQSSRLRSLSWGPGYGFLLTASRKDDGAFTKLEMRCDAQAQGYGVVRVLKDLKECLQGLQRFQSFRVHDAGAAFYTDASFQEILNTMAENVEML